MKRVALQNGVILLELDTIGRILLVLGRDVPGRTGNTAFFVLSALQDYLNSVAFFCHGP